MISNSSPYKIKNLCLRIAKILPSQLSSQLRRIYYNYQNSKKGYYCKALAGESNYNICINSDMTVSCNCSDYDASGHIGDLRTESLQQIFDGEVATRFRQLLSQRKLPIPRCFSCPELASIPRKKAKKKLSDYTLPKKGIMVENTVACNLECTACDRKVVDTRKRRILSLDDMKIISKAICDNSIEQVCYHNLGEPFLSKRIYDELTIFREFNPDTSLVTSTNGCFLDNERKQKAALYFDHIYFSIDGATQSSLEIYQVKGNFDKAYRGMADLVRFRDSLGRKKPVIEWKYVVFEWNDSKKEIEAAVRMAKKANVDIISFWPGGMLEEAGISSRFVNDPYFQELGKKTWKGREIILRPMVNSDS